MKNGPLKSIIKLETEWADGVGNYRFLMYLELPENESVAPHFVASECIQLVAAKARLCSVNTWCSSWIACVLKITWQSQAAQFLTYLDDLCKNGMQKEGIQLSL